MIEDGTDISVRSASSLVFGFLFKLPPKDLPQVLSTVFTFAAVMKSHKTSVSLVVRPAKCEEHAAC